MCLSGVFQCKHGLKEAFLQSVSSVVIYHSYVQLILNIVSMVTEFLPLRKQVLETNAIFIDLNYKSCT